MGLLDLIITKVAYNKGRVTGYDLLKSHLFKFIRYLQNNQQPKNWSDLWPVKVPETGVNKIPSLSEFQHHRPDGGASLTGRAAVSAPAVVRPLHQLQQELLLVIMARHVGLNSGSLLERWQITHRNNCAASPHLHVPGNKEKFPADRRRKWNLAFSSGRHRGGPLGVVVLQYTYPTTP